MSNFQGVTNKAIWILKKQVKAQKLILNLKFSPLLA